MANRELALERTQDMVEGLFPLADFEHLRIPLDKLEKVVRGKSGFCLPRLGGYLQSYSPGYHPHVITIRDVGFYLHLARA